MLLDDATPARRDDILRARLTLALVAGRAHQCPRKTCHRTRTCLGAIRRGGPNVHAPLGDCPNMSEAEWRVVSRGLVWMREVMAQAVRRHDAQLAAALARLPKSEQAELRALAKEQEAAERERGLQRGITYFAWLWMEEDGMRLVAPTDAAGAYAEVVAYWAEREGKGVGNRE